MTYLPLDFACQEAVPVTAMPTPRRVLRMRQDLFTEVEDMVVDEVLVTLVYNGLSNAVMMATPADLQDFALGFSLSEGIIGHAGECYEIEVEYGRDGIAVDLAIASAAFMGLKERRRSLAGAAHAAAWCGMDGELRVVREDVGRHNALDKVIGALARSRARPADGFLLMTSRVSFEMAQKAILAGVPALVGMSAPTRAAIELAEQAGLTLLAFARGRDFVCYTHPRHPELEQHIHGG